MPKIQQQPAYVLHARAYRETSQIVELLSRDHGRVAVVARGAKRPKSALRNTLQPFRPLLMNWSSRGELGTLHSAEQVAAPPVLQGESLYCGLYLNELLTRLLHRNDPHPEVFERYRQVLAHLATGDPVEPLLRLFEKHLLESVGYGLLLEHEHGSGDMIDPDGWYLYPPDKGPVKVSKPSEKTNGVVPGRALMSLQSEQLEADLLPHLRSLMRRVIGYHLGDKPLQSRALFSVHASNRSKP